MSAFKMLFCALGAIGCVALASGDGRAYIPALMFGFAAMFVAVNNDKEEE